MPVCELFTPERYQTWTSADKVQFLENLIRSEFLQSFPQHAFNGDWQSAIQWMSAAPREPIATLRAALSEALKQVEQLRNGLVSALELNA